MSGIKMGMVSLVGSGPGDPGLLTLRAVELLNQADAVVFDKLANFNFLSHLRDSAELFDVGKQADKHTLPQEQINQLLVDLAKQGKRVVRLKGGDPYVFGRGGEEAEELVAHGVPFEVVSGVTSSIAVPASAGIPVTHRDHCTSFHVITGHERADRENASIDYETLAKLKGTLVFLMGIKNLPQIVTGLMEHGRSADTPVAVVSRGCTGRQREVRGTLANIAQIVADAGIPAPAVTIVGTVVNLAEVLQRTGLERPLRGRRVLVTRTRKQAGRLSAKLRTAGAEALEFPLIRVEESPDEDMWKNLLEELPGMDWLVLTSENGVDILFAKMRSLRMDIRDLIGVKVAAVGPATADRLLEHGIVADVVPATYTVEALTSALMKLLQPGDHVALARADIADPLISHRLREMDVSVLEAPIYRTLPEHRFRPYILDLLDQGEIDWITFASSSTVESFVNLLEGNVSRIGKVRIASIGPVTSATARKLGLTVHAEAKVHTLDGLVQALQEENHDIA